MKKYEATLIERNINYFDALIIFLIILFKYLLNFRVPMLFLYLYIIIICVLTIVNIYYKKFTISEFKKIAMFLIISMYFVVLYKDVNFLMSFLLATICIRRDNKGFIKAFFISSAILYLFTIILSKIGVVPSNNMTRIVDGVVFKRESLGFTHPNEVFLYFLPIVLCGYYLFGHKLGYYIVLILVSTMLYKLSYSRTGYIIILLVVFLNLIKNSMKLKIIMPYIMLILTAISIFIAVLYGQNLQNSVSELLSGRPYLWNYYIVNGYMFSILGKGINSQYIMDNFYLFLFIELGLIGYLIYFIIYYKSLKILKYDSKLLIVILLFYIYGLTETNVIIGSIQFAFAIQIKSIIINNKKLNKDVIKNERKISVNNNSGL